MHLSYNPKTDLEIDRVLMASPAAIWRCWTEPDLLKQWFCPNPIVMEQVRFDTRPGGSFAATMRTPSGKKVETDGCILALSPEKMLVFTDALAPGFHPRNRSFLTTVVLLSNEVMGTRYIIRALHSDEDAKERHEKMGFFDGWGRSTDQLESLAKTMTERVVRRA